MATEIKLPELGEDIESGDVLEIMVSVGDVISEGDYIVEMETDKASVPVPAEMGGKVTKICVTEGETVPIGGVIIEMEAAAGSAAPEPASEPETPAAPPAPAAVDPEPVVSPEPTQLAPPAVVPASVPQPVIQPTAPAPAPTTTGNVIAAGPAVRRFAREVGVDLSSVVGTGDGGRITREDVLAVVRSANKSRPPAASANAAPPVPASSAVPGQDLPGTAADDDHGQIRVERMSKIRKTIAKQMHASWSTVPRVTNFDDADITDLERLRQSSKEDYAAQGLKLTTMPFLIKAVATRSASSSRDQRRDR